MRALKQLPLGVITTIALLVGLLATTANANSHLEPVDCTQSQLLQGINEFDIDGNKKLYISELDPSNNMERADLYEVDYDETVIEKTNGFGVNPSDGFIYGHAKRTNNDSYIIRIGEIGTTGIGEFEYLGPTPLYSYIADFTEDGDMIYISGNGIEQRIVRDLDQAVGYATHTESDGVVLDNTVLADNTVLRAHGADIGLVYNHLGDRVAISVDNYGYINIDNLDNNALDATYGPAYQVSAPGKSIPADGGYDQYGAVYAFGDTVYVSSNFGNGVWQINWKQAGETIDVIEVAPTATATNQNDGANCKTVAAPGGISCGIPGLEALQADDPLCKEPPVIEYSADVALVTTGDCISGYLLTVVNNSEPGAPDATYTLTDETEAFDETIVVGPGVKASINFTGFEEGPILVVYGHDPDNLTSATLQALAPYETGDLCEPEPETVPVTTTTVPVTTTTVPVTTTTVPVTTTTVDPPLATDEVDTPVYTG